MVRGSFSKFTVRRGMAKGVLPTFSMRRYKNNIDPNAFVPYRLKSRRLITPNKNNEVQTVYMFPTNINRGRGNSSRNRFFINNNRRRFSFSADQPQQQQPTVASLGGGSGFYNPGLYTMSEPFRRPKQAGFRRRRQPFQQNKINKFKSFQKKNQSQQQQQQQSDQKQPGRNNERRRNRRKNNRFRKPSEADLNAQLDAYMGDDAAKNRLDSQLDAYFGRNSANPEIEDPTKA